MTETSLIQCRNLTKHYPITGGVFGHVTGHVRAVDGLSIHIDKGETYSLVGESGCGKSTTGRMFLLLEKPTAGAIHMDNEDITRLRGAAQKRFRQRVQVVFQDPFSSLNPRMSVGAIVQEGMTIHNPAMTPGEKRGRAAELLALTGLDAAHLDRYPHEFSGGQRQRVGLARALAVEPDFIVADEAVSALDVSIQAQIINLLMDLRDKHGLAYMFITHDLCVVRHISNNIAVMYLGQVVEYAPKELIFTTQRHPYTKALLSAVPTPDLSRRNREVHLLQGEVGNPINPAPGCRFATRCPLATEECKQPQALREAAPGHFVRCHKAE